MLSIFTSFQITRLEIGVYFVCIHIKLQKQMLHKFSLCMEV